MNKRSRSDLAVELVRGADKKGVRVGGVKKTEIIVDEKMSARLNRPKGRYASVESDALLSADRERYGEIIDAVCEYIRSMCEGCETFLAVGIGNPMLGADALGARTVSMLKTNRACKRGRGEKELSAFAPSVSGLTGIESYDIVEAVCKLVKPDCVIIIDSLASAAVSRIGTVFQICDGGLTPGSGVGSSKRALSASTLNVKRTVSVGVPLVVYADTIIRDAVKAKHYEVDEKVAELIVAPKDVDMLTGECAHVISESVNRALGL